MSKQSTLIYWKNKFLDQNIQFSNVSVSLRMTRDKNFETPHRVSWFFMILFWIFHIKWLWWFWVPMYMCGDSFFFKYWKNIFIRTFLLFRRLKIFVMRQPFPLPTVNKHNPVQNVGKTLRNRILFCVNYYLRSNSVIGLAPPPLYPVHSVAQISWFQC